MNAGRAKLQEFGPEQDAARFIGLPRAQFRRLVECKALPGPCRVFPDGTELWDLAQIASIVRGEAARPRQDVQM